MVVEDGVVRTINDGLRPGDRANWRTFRDSLVQTPVGSLSP